MRIPLRSGRDFEQRDNETTPLVALVNEAFVRTYATNEKPIGKHILLDGPGGTIKQLDIIGVVGDVKYSAIGAPTLPTLYQPFAQAPNRRLWLIFRTASESLSGLQASVRRIIREQDKEIYVGTIQPMQTSIGKTLALPRFNTIVLGLFAVVATALAAIGIYGVIAWSVAQRTREIGIRLALGAQRAEILRMVMRHSVRLVLIGVAFGLVVAVGATRLLASLLCGVGSNDLFTYASVILLLSTAALLASYIPARRATKVDPIIALRAE